MKKIISVALAAGLILVSTMPGYAWHGGHFRGSVWIGSGWGPYPYYWYAHPRTVVQQPVIIQQPPAEYVQQTPRADEESYWYYCHDANAYYPYVKKCPSGWMKVVPSSPPTDEEVLEND